MAMPISSDLPKDLPAFSKNLGNQLVELDPWPDFMPRAWEFPEWELWKPARSPKQ